MILFNFNVIARDGAELGARLPDPDGMYLWRTLHEASVGRVGLVVTGEVSNTDILETWLKINGAKAVMYDVLGTTEPKVCAEKIARIISASGGRSMYLDIDPATVSETFAMGIPSMLVCQPYVVRPGWSSQRSMRGWESLVEEIDKQKLARSEKNWGEME